MFGLAGMFYDWWNGSVVAGDGDVYTFDATTGSNGKIITSDSALDSQGNPDPVFQNNGSNLVGSVKTTVQSWGANLNKFFKLLIVFFFVWVFFKLISLLKD